MDSCYNGEECGDVRKKEKQGGDWREEGNDEKKEDEKCGYGRKEEVVQGGD